MPDALRDAKPTALTFEQINDDEMIDDNVITE